MQERKVVGFFPKRLFVRDRVRIAVRITANVSICINGSPQEQTAHVRGGHGRTAHLRVREIINMVGRIDALSRGEQVHAVTILGETGAVVAILKGLFRDRRKKDTAREPDSLPLSGDCADDNKKERC